MLMETFQPRDSSETSDKGHSPKEDKPPNEGQFKSAHHIEKDLGQPLCLLPNSSFV